MSKEEILKKQIKYETIIPGDCLHFPVKGNTVKIHYIGQLQDGTIFDSSRDRGRTTEFKIGNNQILPAIDEMVSKMSKGQRVKVMIPSEEAYGFNGYPPIIPRNANLFYDIELLSFI